MYRLKVKDSTFTIPKENIGLLAFIKAQDMGKIIDPNDKEGAIRFLEGIGIKVEDNLLDNIGGKEDETTKRGWSFAC